MAAEGVCPWPLPPAQYFKLYTDENVESKRVPEPPAAIEGSYAMFGGSFEILVTSPCCNPKIDRKRRMLNVTLLDRIAELKKLNHSILINFLELLDILIESPSSDKREIKVEDLNLLFINIHHLINELRPHQARETLRVMLERQKQQRLETAEKLQRHIDKVVSLIHSSSLALNSVTSEQHKQGKQMEVEADEEEKTRNKDKISKQDHIMSSILDDLT